MRECDIFFWGGVKTYSDSYIFSGGQDPNSRITAPRFSIRIWPNCISLYSLVKTCRLIRGAVCVADLPQTGKTAAVASGGAKQPVAAAAAAGGMSDADADLEARLNNLRRQ